MELKKKRLEQYMWTASSKLRVKPITNVKIHPNSKPVVLIKKKNKIVGELTEKLKIQSALPSPAPEQVSSQLLGRKRTIIELEPEIHILALECNMSLPEGVPFVNNMVIKEPEYGMFFIDVFGDEAFQRWSDINKVGVETLITYLVMASNITIPKNIRFCQKLRELIVKHPDQEKLKSNRVKLEDVGYKLD
ncbi:hypothetical protein Tco_0546227 [Tanacetum coccineum]